MIRKVLKGICLFALMVNVSCGQKITQQETVPYLIGPGGGGTFYHQEINPLDANNIVICSDMSTNHTSVDGGKSFSGCNLQGAARFAFHPADENIVYAYTRLIWISHDKGQHYELLFPQAEHISGIRSGIAEGGGMYANDPDCAPNAPVLALTVNPQNTDKLYFITYGNITSKDKNLKTITYTLYRSDDAGKTWIKAYSFTGDMPKEIVTGLNWDASRERYPTGLDGYWYYGRLAVVNDKLYLLTNSGLYELGENAVTNAVYRPNLNGDISGAQFVVVEKATEQTGKYYTQVSRTGDFGKTWKVVSTTYSDQYKGFDRVAMNGDKMYVHTNMGIIVSDNGGGSWKKVIGDSDVSSSVTEHHWIEYHCDDCDDPDVAELGWSGSGRELTVSKSNPGIAIFSNTCNAYITRDGGGATWQDLASRRTGKTTWTTRGLDNSSVYDFDIDPFDAGHQFISITDIGLFETKDGGRNWENVVRRPGFENLNTCYATQFDPDMQGVIYTAWSNSHDLNMGRAIKLAVAEVSKRMAAPQATKDDSWINRSCVQISRDGGKTWDCSGCYPEGTPLKNNHLPNGLPYPGLFADIVIDPHSPKDRRTIYVASMGWGVYRSTDGGKQWEAFNKGMESEMSRWKDEAGKWWEQPVKTAWRLTWDANEEVLYAVFEPNGSSSGNLDRMDEYPAKGSVYYLTKGAGQWEKLNIAGDVMAFNGVAVTKSGTLYGAGRACLDSEGKIAYGGVRMRKNDRWTAIFPSDSYVYDVAVDPRNENILYICTLNGGKLYVSCDGENTTFDSWREMTQVSITVPIRIKPDMQNPEWIYVAGWGGGLWHVPVKK